MCNFVGKIKRMCETDLGIVSQCINPKKNRNKQYFENLALKINVKVSQCNLLLSYLWCASVVMEIKILFYVLSGWRAQYSA